MRVSKACFLQGVARWIMVSRSLTALSTMSSCARMHWCSEADAAHAAQQRAIPALCQAWVREGGHIASLWLHPCISLHASFRPKPHTVFNTARVRSGSGLQARSIPGSTRQP